MLKHCQKEKKGYWFNETGVRRKDYEQICQIESKYLVT